MVEIWAGSWFLRNRSPWSGAPEQALPNEIQVHVQNRPFLRSHRKDLNLINNQGSFDIFQHKESLPGWDGSICSAHRPK